MLARHTMKQTGSYEQASYAVQDTPDMVAALTVPNTPIKRRSGYRRIYGETTK